MAFLTFSFLSQSFLFEKLLYQLSNSSKVKISDHNLRYCHSSCHLLLIYRDYPSTHIESIFMIHFFFYPNNKKERHKHTHTHAEYKRFFFWYFRWKETQSTRQSIQNVRKTRFKFFTFILPMGNMKVYKFKTNEKNKEEENFIEQFSFPMVNRFPIQ